MTLNKVLGMLVISFAMFSGFSNAAIVPLSAVNQWPNGIIYYDDMSDISLSKQDEIKAAMQLWSSRTPISFRRATSDSQHFIKFIEFGSGCGTGADAIPGRINVWVPCGVGAIAHELGHVIGFPHEQNRTDRDFFIDMDKNKWTSQTEMGTQAIDYGPMDYNSIMMYAMFDKQGTVVGFPPTEPSHGDVEAVYAMYSDAYSVFIDGKWLSGKMFQEIGPSPIAATVNGSAQYALIKGISISDAGLPEGAHINYQAYSSSTWSAPATNGGVLLFPSMQNFTAWLDNAPGYSVQYSIRVGSVWFPWQADGTYAADKKTPGNITGFRFRIKASQKLRTAANFCIDIFQNNTATAGTQVSTWDCTGKGEQQFIFATHRNIPLLTRSAPGAAVTVKETGLQIKTINNLCLIPQNNNLNPGTNIQTGTCCLDGNTSCTPDPKHFWFIDSDNQIKNYSNPARCMKVASSVKGALLQVADCLTGNNERKFFPQP